MRDPAGSFLHSLTENVISRRQTTPGRRARFL